jgi:hypothetical protein
MKIKYIICIFIYLLTTVCSCKNVYYYSSIKLNKNIIINNIDTLKYYSDISKKVVEIDSIINNCNIHLSYLNIIYYSYVYETGFSYIDIIDLDTINNQCSVYTIHDNNVYCRKISSLKNFSFAMIRNKYYNGKLFLNNIDVLGGGIEILTIQNERKINTCFASIGLSWSDFNIKNSPEFNDFMFLINKLEKISSN